jgi:hypothetical protein
MGAARRTMQQVYVSFLAVANLSSIANGQGLICWYSEEGSYRLFLDGKQILPGGISTSKFKNIQSSFGL